MSFVVTERWKRCVDCEWFMPVVAFDAHTREPDGTIRIWQSRCKECAVIANRKAYGHKPRSRQTPKQVLALRRVRYRARMRRRSEEERAMETVIRRIDGKLRRDADKPYPPMKKRNGAPIVDAYHFYLSPDEWLDPRPFFDWLREAYAGYTTAEIAVLLRVSEKVTRDWMDGNRERLSLKVVDRVFCRVGRPDLLELLYPLGTEETS